MDFELFEQLDTKDQLKFVLKDSVDYEYAKNILKTYKINCPIIFQTVYGEDITRLTPCNTYIAAVVFFNLFNNFFDG